MLPEIFIRDGTASHSSFLAAAAVYAFQLKK